MKKIRITVNRGLSGKKFPIFNSTESLYVWINDPEIKSTPDLDPSLGTVVHLRNGETMEVEWRGCEFIYEGNNLLFRADLIRLCKEIKVNVPTLKPIVGIHEGWVVSEVLSFDPKGNKGVRTTKLTDKSRHKFDIDEIFESREAMESLQDMFEETQETKTKILN
jgi:hypothetical protein